jgi:RimJ/RimL family protein N-acetyltransferase
MIEGNLVRLRAVEREDLPTFVRWINDLEVTEFLLLEPPMSLEDEEAWYAHVLKSPDKVFSIETRDGKLIGNIGMINLDWTNRKTDLGIMIGEKEYWSQGYGADAIQIFLRHLFAELNLNRVGLFVDSNNHRALKCYKRCGFRTEGLYRAYRFKRGRYIDCAIMSILREDWERPDAEKEA